MAGLALLLVLLIAMIYYLLPNVRQPRFRWISPGAALALVAWLVASAGFAFYVAQFGSYNATYGSRPARSCSWCGSGSPTWPSCWARRSTPSSSVSAS